MRLTYAIKFVADMDKAVAFHRDKLGLDLRFESPFWSEFETGETKLALHPGIVYDIGGRGDQSFNDSAYAGMSRAKDELGISFTQAPTEMHGTSIARFRDVDGAETSVSGPM